MSPPHGSEIVGSRQIDITAVDILGEAGIGKGRQGQVRHPSHALEHPQDFTGPGAAIGADDGGAGHCQAAGHLFGGTAFPRAPFLDKGHLGYHRQSQGAADPDRQLQVIEGRKGFEQKEIDPSFGQGFHLLPENFSLFHRP